jgi:dephospho-CoA kinase
MCTEVPIPNVPRSRRGPATGPLVLALVGPTGSGKSTVARALGEAGARVLDADRIGHEITDGVPEVRRALAEEYGADVYRPDGTLDRRRVAAKVFSDPAALTRLNLLVHPRILERLRAAIAAAAQEQFTGAVVVDAALLLDWGFERECDAVIAVIAPVALQIARLMAARGWSEAEARQRLARARSNQAFADVADEVIVNDGSEAEAAAAARAALARLSAKRAGAGA